MASIPAVHALEKEHAARGLRVIGVVKGADDAEDKQRVVDVAKEHHMTGPSFLDSGGSWSKAADIDVNPGFLLLDREGKVAYRYVGKLDEGSEAYKAMSELLAKM